MSIIIGADIVPTEGNASFFTKEDVDSIVGDDLIKILDSASYRVFNLETPLADEPTPILKAGRAFCVRTSVVPGLKRLGVDLFALANNHIMDQGVNGLISTMNLLNAYEIAFTGVGNNLEDAQSPFIVNINGKVVGVYACAEHEFSIADENSPGANPFNPLESFDSVASLRQKCDFVVVLYHGGKEHYQYPSPFLQKVCRKFVRVGANLVVCQHSHCIGCEEKYENGTIVYGQGNFVFDDCKGPFVHSSLLVKINDDFSIDYIPLIKVDKGVRIASDEKAKKILLEFRRRSEEIKSNEFVKNEYNKFAKNMLNKYLLTCSGYQYKWMFRFFDKLCAKKLSKIVGKKYYSRKEILAIRNFIECEAHRELWIEGLKDVTK